MNRLPKLVVVAGTTASGKSDLGVELAKRFNGEVVSADSRQVFRGLDLGSGKITPEETQEQAALRKEYLEEFRRGFRAQLENIVIVDEEGNRKPLKKDIN